ncbi:hypothetical protein M3Y95_00412900 [Aphelenchoides besseyi]|nr:hypothetical protein M3Y95_00412900 [Aphelenchoides besseyi]
MLRYALFLVFLVVTAEESEESDASPEHTGILIFFFLDCIFLVLLIAGTVVALVLLIPKERRARQQADDRELKLKKVRKQLDEQTEEIEECKKQTKQIKKKLQSNNEVLFPQLSKQLQMQTDELRQEIDKHRARIAAGHRLSMQMTTELRAKIKKAEKTIDDSLDMFPPKKKPTKETTAAKHSQSPGFQFTSHVSLARHVDGSVSVEHEKPQTTTVAKQKHSNKSSSPKKEDVSFFQFS